MNTHVRERAIFVQSSPAFLTRLDAMIEELIAMRDALDGDADFEPAADDEDDGTAEPTLGAPEAPAPRSLRHAWARGSTLDGEGEVTTGTLAADRSQEHVPETYFVADDCEDSHDNELEQGDDEPNLGAPERHAPGDSQDDWAQNGGWADEMEITMPTATTFTYLGASQDVDPRLCGYLAPDDFEDGGDLEPDGLFGDGRTEYDAQWQMKMRRARQARRASPHRGEVS